MQSLENVRFGNKSVKGGKPLFSHAWKGSDLQFAFLHAQGLNLSMAQNTEDVQVLERRKIVPCHPLEHVLREFVSSRFARCVTRMQRSGLHLRLLGHLRLLRRSNWIGHDSPFYLRMTKHHPTGSDFPNCKRMRLHKISYVDCPHQTAAAAQQKSSFSQGLVTHVIELFFIMVHQL